jgi:tetratricopeptide (TPR) repeat protein
MRSLVRIPACLIAVATLALAGCNMTPDTPERLAAERAAEANRLFSEGLVAQRAGRAFDAAGYYRRAVELNPNLYAAWNNLGVVLMEQNLNLDAAASFKRALEVSDDPHDPRPYENLGLLYDNAGFSDQALEYYRLALEREPHSPAALRGTALAARRLQRGDERLAEAMRRGLMVETDPKWREVFEREKLRIEDQLRQQEKARREGR